MKHKNQQYDSLNNTVKALEFSPGRTRARSRIRRNQTYNGEDIARKGPRVGTAKQGEFPKSRDLSRICETQV